MSRMFVHATGTRGAGLRRGRGAQRQGRIAPHHRRPGGHPNGRGVLPPAQRRALPPLPTRSSPQNYRWHAIYRGEFGAKNGDELPTIILRRLETGRFPAPPHARRAPGSQAWTARRDLAPAARPSIVSTSVSKQAAACDTSARPSSVRLTSTARRSVGRRNAHDQAAPLRAVDQAGDAGLVESQEPRQLVHGRRAVPQHAEQARLDDREAVLGGPALEHALNHEGELSQPVDGAQLASHAAGSTATCPPVYLI